MVDRKKEFCDRVIQSCERGNQFISLEDGFCYFWIEGHGALSAEALRVIADELDRRNKGWQGEIDNYFNGIIT